MHVNTGGYQGKSPILLSAHSCCLWTKAICQSQAAIVSKLTAMFKACLLQAVIEIVCAVQAARTVPALAQVPQVKVEPLVLAQVPLS